MGETSAVSTPPRHLLVLALAPLLCVLPFAALFLLNPDSLDRTRDVLAGVCVAGVGYYFARRFTRRAP